VLYRRYDIALDHLAAGLEYCTERGLDTFRLYLLGSRARLELDLGRWDAAADSAGLVLGDPRSAQLARTWALATLGLLRSRRDEADATALLVEAHAMVAPTFELDRITQVAAARAEEAWLSGDHATVRQVTDAALTLALDRGDPWAVGELACWRWRAGALDESPPSAAEPYARQISGDWQGAAELWQEIGCPYEAALARAEADDDETLRRAWDDLRRLGASPAAALVARRLRQRGARGLPRGPRKATRQNPAQLTARELEVLELVAQGLGNAQIAERLFLSQKTVAHHVSAILRKLGVRTRTQASAQAVRLGLAAEDR
jgi:DNA-binding CsgD family transcriptional regulator